MSMLGCKLNYYALTVAIIADCSVETAFEKLEGERPSTVKAKITDQDVKDMRVLKAEGLTYSQIGEIYGMRKDAVYARLRRMPKET